MSNHEPYGFTQEREAYSRRVSRRTPVQGGLFTFGKYKGEPVMAIRDSDPQYFRWCQENVENFKEFCQVVRPKKNRRPRKPRKPRRRD